eukprot:8972090-Pyramimonas_sp.AAC.1
MKRRKRGEENAEEEQEEEEGALLHATLTSRLRLPRASGRRNALSWPELALSSRSRIGDPDPLRLGGGRPHVHARARRLHSNSQGIRCMARSASAV